VGSGKFNRAPFCRCHDRLLDVMMMVVVVMMMVVNYDHDLRLRCIGDCKAEEESESKPILLHPLLSRFVALSSRAILTSSQKNRIACKVNCRRDGASRVMQRLTGHE
jgi:hypothetical protein